MTCSACSNGLEKYLNKQEGIKEASVNLVMATASVEYDENIVKDSDLDRFVKEAGFKSLGERSKDGNYVRVVKKTEISEEPNNNRNERLEKRIVVEEIITTEKTVEVPSYNPRYKYKNNKGNQDDKKDEETKHYSYKVNRQTYTKESQNEDNNDGSDSKRYHRRYRASNRSNDKSNENNNNNGNTTYSRYRRKV